MFVFSHLNKCLQLLCQLFYSKETRLFQDTCRGSNTSEKWTQSRKVYKFRHLCACVCVCLVPSGLIPSFMMSCPCLR